MCSYYTIWRTRSCFHLQTENNLHVEPGLLPGYLKQSNMSRRISTFWTLQTLRKLEERGSWRFVVCLTGNYPSLCTAAPQLFFLPWWFMKPFQTNFLIPSARTDWTVTNTSDTSMLRHSVCVCDWVYENDMCAKGKAERMPNCSWRLQPWQLCPVSAARAGPRLFAHCGYCCPFGWAFKSVIPPHSEPDSAT